MATLFLIVIYAAFISLGLPDGLLGAGWPTIQGEFQVPFGFAGFVSITISGGTIISSLLSGRTLNRFGTGKVTFVSVMLTALALFGFFLVPSFWWMIVMAIPLGLGAGSVDAGLNDYVAKHYKAHHMSWLHCFWGIGAMTGPIIMSQFLGVGESWRNSYLTVAVIQFGLVALLFLTLPLWGKVAALNKPQVAEAVHTESGEKFEHTGLFSPLKLRGVKAVLIVFLFYCGVESTMGLWGSSYMVTVKGMEPAIAARWVSLFYGSITFGRFINGFVAMRFSSKTIIRAGELSILVGVVLMLLPLPEVFTMASFVLIGLGCAPIYPSMLHETPNRFGYEAAQSIMGFQMAVAYIGATFLPPIFGFIASNLSFNLLPVFILAYISLMLFNSEQVNRFMTRKTERQAAIVAEA